MSLVRAALDAFGVTDRRWAYLDDVIIREGDTEVYLQRLQRMLEVLRRFGSERDLGGSRPRRNSAKRWERATPIIRQALDPGDAYPVPARQRPETEQNPQASPGLIIRRPDGVTGRDQPGTESAESQAGTVANAQREELENDAGGLGLPCDPAAGAAPLNEPADAGPALQPSPAGKPGRASRRREGRETGGFPQDTPARGSRPRLIRTLKRMCSRSTVDEKGQSVTPQC